MANRLERALLINSDSFWVSVDGSETVLWDLPEEDNWTWTTMTPTWELKEGNHVIRVQAREKGARLDALKLIWSSRSEENQED